MTTAIEPKPRQIHILILSGTWDEWVQWLAYNRKCSGQTRRVTDEASLLGITMAIVVRTGTWKSNPMATSKQLQELERHTSKVLRNG